MTTSNRTPAKDADEANEAAEDGLGLVIPGVMLAQEVQNAQPTFSKCCDSEYPVQGIADILEGFGLLNGSEATDVLSDDAVQLILGAYQQALAELSSDRQQSVADIHTAASAESEAGMLEVQLPMDMQAQLKVLIKEYLCSLENAGSAEEQTIDTAGLFLDLNGTNGDRSRLMQSALPESGRESDNVTAPARSMPSGQNSAGNILEAIRSAVLKNVNDGQRGDMQSKSTVLPENGSSKTEAQSTAAFPLHQSAPAPVDGVDLAASTTAAAVSGSDMADNIANIVARVSTQAANGTQEFTIALKPDHLGKLSIKLIMDNDGIQAQIKAANASTRGLIQNELPALAEMLRDKGINVRQIEVSYEAPAFSFDTRQGPSQGQYSDSPGKSQYSYAADRPEPYGSIAESGGMQEILLQGSSVEFQA